MATSSSGTDKVVITLQRVCAEQLCPPKGSTGDVVILSIDRTCATQLLVALTFAMGGKPNQKVIPNQGKKGKGKGKGKSSGKSSAAKKK